MRSTSSLVRRWTTWRASGRGEVVRRRCTPWCARSSHRYQAILKADNLLDFTGILDEARRELEDPDLREFLRGLRLFVDEGQDVNPHTEWPILEVLRQGAGEFVMFASPSQQIYGFRGASWETLCHQLPDDLNLESMRENYRSTPEIVRTAARLAGPDADNMLSTRESIQSPVEAVDALNPEVEADYVGRQVAQWLGQGVKLEEVAVLARVHTMLNTVQMSLRARDIPFQIVGGPPKHLPARRDRGRPRLPAGWRWTRWTTACSRRSSTSRRAASACEPAMTCGGTTA